MNDFLETVIEIVAIAGIAIVAFLVGFAAGGGGRK